MRTLSARKVAVVAVAALTLTSVGCGTRESATMVTPAPQPAVPTSAAPPPSPTPEISRRPKPEYLPESRQPPIQPELVSQFVAQTPSPSAAGSSRPATSGARPSVTNSPATSPARRNPAPSGSVDCATSKCVALTFDDGPGPHTARLLGMLISKDARATFFMTGQMVRANPGVARQVANTPGMEIGNHSATHAQLTRVGPAQIRREVVGTHAAIKEATGQNVTIFRPPYGSHSASVDAMAAEAGESVILWDIDTNDWQTRSATATRQAVAQNARAGSIVLMHDIHGSTVDAVPGIIDDLQGRGYVLVTVSELLGGTSPGRVYSRR